MNPILTIFNRPRVLLPVIHPVSRNAALRALDVAQQAGADGAFLIDQGMEAGDVLRLVREIRTANPEFFVGVNLLDESPADIAWCFFPQDPDYPTLAASAIWSDRADPIEKLHGWRGLYFGGVSFKYQPASRDEAAAIREALASGVDVVTTSGPATGKAASLDKVLRFREALGDRPLALASGVSAGNVRAFLPYVDAFLVASSIEREFGVLDGEKVRELADIVHGG